MFSEEKKVIIGIVIIKMIIKGNDKKYKTGVLTNQTSQFFTL